MKIYTKTGDKGTSHLQGGRAKKSSEIYELLGTLDEFSAKIGEFMNSTGIYGYREPDYSLYDLQSRMLDLGGELSKARLQRWEWTTDETEKCERVIDALDKDLPPLKNFILPGGPSAAIHSARAIIRKAERQFWRVMEEEKYSNTEIESYVEASQNIGKYLNRLSDLLFVMARVINHDKKVEDVIWRKMK